MPVAKEKSKRRRNGVCQSLTLWIRASFDRHILPPPPDESRQGQTRIPTSGLGLNPATSQTAGIRFVPALMFNTGVVAPSAAPSVG